MASSKFFSHKVQDEVPKKFKPDVVCERVPVIESRALSIRDEKDKIFIKDAISCSGRKEKKQKKLMKQVRVNVLRSEQIDVSGRLYMALHDEKYKAKIKEWQARGSIPSDPKFRATKEEEFGMFIARRWRETFKPGADVKLFLLFQMHGHRYASWEDARQKSLEDQRIFSAFWKKTRMDPWRCPVRIDGVPFFPSYVPKATTKLYHR